MIQHNSQGEAFDTVNEKYEFIYIIKFFSLNFLIVFALSFSIIVMARSIHLLFNRIVPEEPPKD